ncbi:hypothetical protein [endosymbiont GvMRE of Glomus versiforme]|uniref:hypothetical protein n=1 Tax=endosymbiont GvMRE of Glomus versiforme TaxID=2039283 RepID=UPI000ED20939|nr:hypothetical protein [endosymbiont GvMRE of Glomus versiforme]RHZ35927.1 hypothetical protein GvMRE_Ic4g99 [endosymbiont GvMRE of Glomus versiforme]
MRIARIEPRHTFSIYLPTSLYQKLINKAGKGKISTFIKQVLEEKLITEEQNQKENLRKQLIKDYQAQAKNKRLQRELKAMERTQFEDSNDK